MADVTFTPGDFSDAAARTARAASKTLRTWAFEVERRAKIKAAVDTGFNRNTIYTVGPDGKLYSNQQLVATRPGLPVGPSRKHPKRKSYNAGAFAEMAPTEGGYQDVLASFGGGLTNMVGGTTKLGPIRPSPDAITTEVRVGSNYGIFQELGTVHSKAQPYLGPSAAEVTPRLDGMMQKNLKAEGLAQ